MRRGRIRSVLLTVGAMAAVAGGLVVWVAGQEAEAASGPCGTSHDALDAEEQQFLTLLQQWRDENLSNSTPLEVSGALNAAAAWFAEYLVEGGTTSGHTDSYGRDWTDRAQDCGFEGAAPPNQRWGSGEGTFHIAASQPLDIGPAEAIEGITYPGSGVYIQVPDSGFYPPVKCVGVAVARSGDGSSVAWIAVIAQYTPAAPCPESSVGGSTSATATPTGTPTATPSPTPSPTPTPFRAVAPDIARED